MCRWPIFNYVVSWFYSDNSLTENATCFSVGKIKQHSWVKKRTSLFYKVYLYSYSALFVGSLTQRQQPQRVPVCISPIHFLSMSRNSATQIFFFAMKVPLPGMLQISCPGTVPSSTHRQGLALAEWPVQESTYCETHLSWLWGSLIFHHSFPLT